MHHQNFQFISLFREVLFDYFDHLFTCHCCHLMYAASVAETFVILLLESLGLQRILCDILRMLFDFLTDALLKAFFCLFSNAKRNGSGEENDKINNSQKISQKCNVKHCTKLQSPPLKKPNVKTAAARRRPKPVAFNENVNFGRFYDGIRMGVFAVVALAVSHVICLINKIY